MTMKKKAQKTDTPVETFTVSKIVEFGPYAYYESAQRLAMAHAQTFHFVKVRHERGNYFVEIYKRP